jgi:hypothetical protein
MEKKLLHQVIYGPFDIPLKSLPLHGQETMMDQSLMIDEMV